jgi:hypothetical protein
MSQRESMLLRKAEATVEHHNRLLTLLLKLKESQTKRLHDKVLGMVKQKGAQAITDQKEGDNSPPFFCLSLLLKF